MKSPHRMIVIDHDPDSFVFADEKQSEGMRKKAAHDSKYGIIGGTTPDQHAQSVIPSQKASLH